MATPLTVGDAVTHYLAARRYDLRPASLTAVHYNLRRFALETGWHRPLNRIRQRHIRGWLDNHHGAPRGDRQRLSLLRTFFRWHVEAGHLKTDPTIGLRTATVPRAVPQGVAPEVVSAVLEVVPDARGRLIVLLCVQELLRRGEVVGLELGDVEPTERALLVRDGKGGHQRVVPISDETWAALEAYLAEHPATAGPLVRSYTRPHDAISADYVTQLVRKWRKIAGVSVTPHRLRHTGATHMLRKGAHIRDVQAGLGHASLATTQVYMPLNVHDLREAMGGRNYTGNHSADRIPPSGRCAEPGQSVEINGNGGPPRLPDDTGDDPT